MCFFFFLRIVGWLSDLTGAFGLRYLMAVACFQFVLKGFVAIYTYTSFDFVLRVHMVPGPRMQILRSIIYLPWALKPVVGIVSDAFPICGYRKSPYIVAASCLGTASFTAIGHYGVRLPLWAVVVAFFGMSVQITTCDLLTEAATAERLRQSPEFGPAMMSFVSGGITLGAMAGTLTIGWVMQNFGPAAPALVCTIPSLLMLAPALGNCLAEKKDTAQATQARRAVFAGQWEVLLLVGAMGVGSTMLVLVGISDMDQLAQLRAVAGIAVAVIGLFTTLLSPTIGLMNAFFFLQSTSTISIEGGTFYFFTDDSTSFPTGPHFSVWFYTTALGFTASSCGLLGLWMYNRFMTGWRYRSLFVTSNLLWCIFSASTVPVFTRRNLEWGIPDKAFVLGSTVLQQVVENWAYVPGGVLLSQVCPSGMEATMFALLAGCHNLGRSLANYFGSFMLVFLEVSPDGSARDETQFTKLWEAAIVQALAPLVTLWMIPAMIPDASQKDRIGDGRPSAATHGSPWSRLLGHYRERHDQVGAAEEACAYGATGPSASERGGAGGEAL